MQTSCLFVIHHISLQWRYFCGKAAWGLTKGKINKQWDDTLHQLQPPHSYHCHSDSSKNSTTYVTILLLQFPILNLSIPAVSKILTSSPLPWCTWKPTKKSCYWGGGQESFHKWISHLSPKITTVIDLFLSIEVLQFLSLQWGWITALQCHP